MDEKTSSSSSGFHLDGITDADLRQIAEWRNAQRDVLRSPGFTHTALQRDWLIEMRKQGGLVAAIRRHRISGFCKAHIGSHLADQNCVGWAVNGLSLVDCVGYVALYPRHGDYAELGWLHGDGITDEECVRLGLDFARACGLSFLVAETCGKSSLTAMRQREAALEAAGFRFSRGTQEGETWRTFWTSAV